MRRDINQAEAREKQLLIYGKQPYTTSIDNFEIVVGKGVYPPDDSLDTVMVMQSLRDFEPKIALDMGCGCGVLALQMHRLGADVVYAVDRHRAAIECARDNAARNGINDIRVLQSDLFSAIPPSTRFDLIAFNQTQAPSDSDLFGPAHDGGAELINRFFDSVVDFIVPNGAVVMAFSADAGSENDPAALARARGFEVEEISFVQGKRGESKAVLIYPVVLTDS